MHIHKWQLIDVILLILLFSKFSLLSELKELALNDQESAKTHHLYSYRVLKIRASFTRTNSNQFVELMDFSQLCCCKIKTEGSVSSKIKSRFLHLKKYFLQSNVVCELSKQTEPYQN